MAVTPIDYDDVPMHDVPKGGRSGFTVIDGRQVHYLEWGHGGAPQVLCLHGGGQTAYMYEELGAVLADRYHLLAPDLPNHGDSAALDEAFGPETIAATIPALLDHFGFESVDLVGASLGGMAGLFVAAAHPERVRSIALIDVGHQLEPEGVRKIIDFMGAHESFASLEEAADEIGKYLPQRKSVRPESLTRNLRQRDDGRWVWKHAFGRRFRQLGEGEHPVDNLDVLQAAVREAAVEVTCPTLVLRGAQSDVLSDEGAAAAVDLIPDARLAVVENAGHLAAGDNPRSTVNLIADFLADPRSPQHSQEMTHG